MTLRWKVRLTHMRLVKSAIVILASAVAVWRQAAQLKTANAVLDRYKHVLGGVDAIAKVQSETVRGEIEAPACQAKRPSC